MRPCLDYVDSKLLPSSWSVRALMLVTRAWAVRSYGAEVKTIRLEAMPKVGLSSRLIGIGF